MLFSIFVFLGEPYRGLPDPGLGHCDVVFCVLQEFYTFYLKQAFFAKPSSTSFLHPSTFPIADPRARAPETLVLQAFTIGFGRSAWRRNPGHGFVSFFLGLVTVVVAGSRYPADHIGPRRCPGARSANHYQNSVLPNSSSVFPRSSVRFPGSGHAAGDAGMM